MDTTIKSKLNSVVTRLIMSKEGGIVDAIRFCNRVINYFIYQGRIYKYEKKEYCQYVVDLFDSASQIPILPDHKQLLVETMMQDDYFSKELMGCLNL